LHYLIQLKCTNCHAVIGKTKDLTNVCFTLFPKIFTEAFQSQSPISKIHGHMLEIFDIRFLSITPLLDRCGPNCCASEKEVFSVHHGNSVYIQVSNNGIYENPSHCMANSRLGCEQRKSFVSRLCSEEQ